MKMLNDPSSRFWLGMLTLLSVSIGVLFMASTQPLRAENESEAAICRGLADDVLAGEATRFDYMATHCPAELLSSAGDT